LTHSVVCNVDFTTNADIVGGVSGYRGATVRLLVRWHVHARWPTYQWRYRASTRRSLITRAKYVTRQLISNFVAPIGAWATDHFVSEVPRITVNQDQRSVLSCGVDVGPWSQGKIFFSVSCIMFFICPVPSRRCFLMLTFIQLPLYW